MNGYFNNLAIRTVSRGNLVEPRVASVFEPQSVVEPATVETAARPLATDHTDKSKPVLSTSTRNSVAASESVATKSPVNAVAEEPLEEALLEPTVSHAEPAPLVYETEGQHSEPESRITKVVPAKTPPVLPNSPAPANEVLVREDATVEPPETITATTPATAPTTATKRTTVRQTQSIAATRAPLAATVPETQVEKSISPPPGERSAPVSVKSVVHEATTTATHHFSERLVKQTTTRREQLLLEAPPDPEPSINVTIGRVEVRATPAPSPKQKPARTASPVMPLEEYLRKQRRGDER